MKTLGSLFDGSGGFPLAWRNLGGVTLYSSEIDPFALAVEKKNFPEVEQLGDITKITDAPQVDVITMGSPCQDLSVSGAGKGLAGNKSRLFLDAIKFITEQISKGKGPSFVVWENVPGALTSNNGNDFKKVLESFLQLKGLSYDLPKPERWGFEGAILGDSIAINWRVLDAKEFGLAQKRRRIYLVVDLRAGCSGELLFIRKGNEVPTEKRRAVQQDTARLDTGRNRKTYSLTPRAGIQGRGGKGPCVSEEYVGALLTSNNHYFIIRDEDKVTIRHPTILEMSRLQGFPDDWLDGVEGLSKRTAEVLWGNGVALPCVEFVLDNVYKELNNEQVV